VMQGRQFSAVEQQKLGCTRGCCGRENPEAAAAAVTMSELASCPWHRMNAWLLAGGQDNSDWLVTTWIAATMIQARWRCYHVKRKKLDKASTTIQRIIRAFLVRRLLSKRRKAIVIQRHARGVITRNRLRAKHRAAVKAQSLIRGFLGRRRVKKKRLGMDQLALTIQCAVRCHQARRRVQVRRDAAADAKARVAGAVNIQRIYRGIQGRNQATEKLAEYNTAMEQHRAATKLPAMARRDAAIKRVDKIRLDKFEEMNKAATTIRKLWKGKKTRRKYQQLMEEFARHVDNVITIQRYARGFLVRLRMWRQAVRAEEELWASLEIQRVWRGYLGRVKWEAKYEEVWQKEMAAAMIERNIRGWLARAKVGRIRRRIARAEFERARKRFRAAQRIQALVRGVLVRIRFVRRYARARTAAVRIQRVARGHALRKRLWHQVKAQKATYIEAHARGFLVKRRRLHLMLSLTKTTSMIWNFKHFDEATPAVHLQCCRFVLMQRCPFQCRLNIEKFPRITRVMRIQRVWRFSLWCNSAA
ncbi:MYO5B, partial [Symbiodinium sp. CCMP2456]